MKETFLQIPQPPTTLNFPEIVENSVILAGENCQAAFLREHTSSFPRFALALKGIIHGSGAFYMCIFVPLSSGINHKLMLDELKTRGIKLAAPWAGVNSTVSQAGNFTFRRPTSETSLLQPEATDPLVIEFMWNNGFTPGIKPNKWTF